MDINNKENPILTMSYDNFINSPEHDYYIYCKEHIKDVNYAYNYIKTNIPELLSDLEIPVKEMDEQIKKHDDSKFSPEEFEDSAQYYYGTKDEDRYNLAWEHHWRNNPHHPEYWQGKSMPYSCLLEMLCDLWSFGWKEMKQSEIFKYWNEHRDEKEKIMFPDSFAKFEEMLKILKEKTDDKLLFDFKKIKDKVDLLMEDVAPRIASKNFKIGKDEAVDAVITSRTRHKIEHEENAELDPRRRRALHDLKMKLSMDKDFHLTNLVNAAKDTNDRISVDIRDDDLRAINTKSITADFDGISHMSLHTIRGKNPVLDRNQKGRTKSTGYGENDDFIKYATGKNINDLVDANMLKLKKKYDLAESDLSELFEDTEPINKLEIIKNIQKEVGSYQYDDKSENMKKLPDETEKEKKGMCHDTALLVSKRLKDAGFKDDEHGILAIACRLYDNGWTHSFSYAIINGKYYWIECSWYGLKGIHGPYNSIEELKKDFEDKSRKYDKRPDEKIYWETYKLPEKGEKIMHWCQRVF